MCSSDLSGEGLGEGSGWGSGLGSGRGSGWGSGSVWDLGSDIAQFNGEAVYMIDNVQTILRQIHGSMARGAILNGDLTLTPCWVAKVGNCFAHGETAHEAREAALSKAFEDMPESERIAAFRATFVNATPYPNALFFEWHNRLTGSCEMGRKQFAREHNIDLKHGTMTPEEFIRLTENAYGGSTVRKLRPLYGMEERDTG